MTQLSPIDPSVLTALPFWMRDTDAPSPSALVAMHQSLDPPAVHGHAISPHDALPSPRLADRAVTPRPASLTEPDSQSGDASPSALAGAMACLFGHWLSDVYARMGATEEPAHWVAYAITFGLLAFIVSAIGVRVTEGRWLWGKE